MPNVMAALPNINGALCSTRQSCATVPRWRFFESLLRPAFLASRAQQVSDLHSKFALRPRHVLKYGKHPISDR